MNVEFKLFPANYWLETSELPPVKIVECYSGKQWNLVRCYINQEGGTSACVVAEEYDLATAEQMLVVLKQELHVMLRFLAERKIHQAA